MCDSGYTRVSKWDTHVTDMISRRDQLWDETLLTGRTNQMFCSPGEPHLDCFTKCLPWNLFCDKHPRPTDQMWQSEQEGNMFNHQLKRAKTRNSWWQSSIRYFWKTWNIPGFDLAWQNHTRTPQERRTSADSVTSHKCVPLTGSLMDCVYVYTVVASRRVQALLRNLLWAEHEDKYTNPVDRKETVRHI